MERYGRYVVLSGTQVVQRYYWVIAYFECVHCFVFLYPPPLESVFLLNFPPRAARQINVLSKLL